MWQASPITKNACTHAYAHIIAHIVSHAHSVSAGYTVNDLKCCVRHTFAHKQLLIKKPINTVHLLRYSGMQHAFRK